MNCDAPLLFFPRSGDYTPQGKSIHQTGQTFAASISAVGKRETVDYSDALQKFLEETTWKISILQR
jgi:hypothetical protein